MRDPEEIENEAITLCPNRKFVPELNHYTCGHADFAWRGEATPCSADNCPLAD